MVLRLHRWVGAVLVAVRDVVGVTVGSLGAVLGGCCFGKPQLTTRKGGITNRFGGCKSGTQSKAAVG